MKVIVANYRYFVAGGPEKYMFKFMEAAEKKGIDVIPFSINNPRNVETQYSKYFAKPRSKQLMYSETKKTLGNYWGIVRATVWNWDASRRLKQLIRDTHPDVIYILHEVNHLSPSIIRTAKKEGVKVVHRISDFFMFCPKYDFLCGDEICEYCLKGDYHKAIKEKCVKGSLFGTLLRVFAMRFYEFVHVFDDVDLFVCTCEFTKNKLIQGGVNASKIQCIPTFINSSNIEPCYDNDHYFLFLGRLAHQKGAIYAIEAMKWLKETDYTLKITGTLSNTDDSYAIKRCIADNDMEDKIIFTGFKSGDELDELINRCTAVVCPAIWYENMPNTVIEAYAHGKPVIASNIGSLAEIVIDGETGYLFEMKNSKELAGKMRLFINDKRLCERMGKQARSQVEVNYSENIHMEKLIRVLK